MKPHTEILAGCAEKFATLEGIAESYKTHKEESVKVRDQVITNTEIINNLCGLRRLWTGAIFTIVFGLLSIAVMWGSLLNRVSNLEKYTEFILKHSYGVQDWEKAGTKQ